MGQKPERLYHARRPDLTPEEIIARAAAIREAWSEKTELRRRVTPPGERTAGPVDDLPSAGTGDE